MSQQLTYEQVWTEIKKELFAVLGMVTAKGEARTVGIVYVAHNNKIYIATGTDTWKARHIRQNAHVSITVPISKRIPFMPWIKIPAATITFSGLGTVLDVKSVGEDIIQALFRGLEADSDLRETMCVIEIEPIDDFITYGVGIPLMTMRDPEKARNRVPVASQNTNPG
jgi:hypothetical protein